MTHKRKFGVNAVKPKDSGIPEDAGAHPDNKYRERDPAIHSMAMTETAAEHSTIREKEEALEQIMCGEAETAFNQMNRHEMHPSKFSRCCIDPEHAANYDEDYVWSILNGSDLQEVVSDSDDEFVKEQGLDVFELKPGANVPVNQFAPDYQCGYHFPSFKQESQQDRMFVAHSGPHTLFGLINGHGQSRLSHELCEFISKEMPRAIFRSRHFVKGDIQGALNSGFLKVHRKAIEAVDCRFTGAACTVLLLSPTTIWVAHVGDCKVVLGVPDEFPNAKEYHFHPVTLTKGHGVDLQGEFDRIVQKNGEVRILTNDHSHRIFVKNMDFPGLTLTRAIGDRVGHQIGVTHSPSVCSLKKAELKQGSFFAIASGGLWAMMSERTAVNWIGRYFEDANEAARCLADEATKRWDDPPQQQHFHRGSEPDCFSAMVLFPTSRSTAATSPQTTRRAFAAGPHCRQAPRTWKQMKAVTKLVSLRKAMELEQERQGTLKKAMEPEPDDDPYEDDQDDL
eukprot:gnl/MRDRNA2_/MRDRNA2_97002_c0_seq1.p1 gnl/MRDRNA2_/MRDRNA2_97002_c0~~gnl/MRDRNA2_/MRDRNA2_97002_c0_seq1.p1  ORF type:complete len:581 (-),score=114.87 gnl/MRDRNA2_/MRDRNA2_97002_c0_seq1:86-1609(-)